MVASSTWLGHQLFKLRNWVRIPTRLPFLQGDYMSDEPIKWLQDTDVVLVFNGGDRIHECIDLSLIVSKKLDHSVSFEFNGKNINVHHWNSKESILKQYM